MGESSTSIEAERRAAAVSELLRRISVSEGAESQWWNLTRYAELGDRTPTEAWLAGDHVGVEELIARWYADSEKVAQRYRDDPGLMASLHERSAVLRRTA